MIPRTFLERFSQWGKSCTYKTSSPRSSTWPRQVNVEDLSGYLMVKRTPAVGSGLEVGLSMTSRSTSARGNATARTYRTFRSGRSSAA